ncbi:hypothetical protein SLE2022_402920 [Rubroshorea leprosula]
MSQMENNSYLVSGQQDRLELELLPSFLELPTSNQVFGFNNIKQNSSFQPCTSSAMATETFDVLNATYESQPIEVLKHSVSISKPISPMQATSKSNNFANHDGILDPSVKLETGERLLKQVQFYSKPLMTEGAVIKEPVKVGNLNHHPNIRRLKDTRFESFKTWSRKLEKQISNLKGKPQNVENEALPADRYFDALEGPELETLRPSEEIVLPNDKTWPFLLRFPISSFGICLGLSSQAILWKALATAPSTKFLHINFEVNRILWCISLALLAIVFTIYLLKVIFFFEAVRREYFHPIRVNFFFAPWIVILLLCLGVPPIVAENLPKALWYFLMVPILCLELKIYGQWMSGGQRKLSKVANPSNHLSIIGNFVGAMLGASMGLKEGPIFFFAVGLAHYTVLFVTLYQRLPTNETLPKELHPVFFLFVAAPSAASLAWAEIRGFFDHGSRIAYFIALFLYFSLAVRVNFFRGFKFSLAWWAYTFPMTGAATASIRYSSVVTNVGNQTLAVIFSVVATVMVIALLVTTIIHAFVLRDLFPNDIAIAISDKKPKPHRKWFHRRNGSLVHARDINNFLKLASEEGTDLESCLKPGPQQQ